MISYKEFATKNNEIKARMKLMMIPTITEVSNNKVILNTGETKTISSLVTIIMNGMGCISNPSKIKGWKNFAENQVEKKKPEYKNVPSYNGYHFKGVGRVHESDNILNGFGKDVLFDKNSYNYAAFYAAMGKKTQEDTDIFYCMETKKNYVPSNYCLMEYVGNYEDIVAYRKRYKEQYPYNKKKDGHYTILSKKIVEFANIISKTNKKYITVEPNIEVGNDGGFKSIIIGDTSNYPYAYLWSKEGNGKFPTALSIERKIRDFVNGNKKEVKIYSNNDSEYDKIVEFLKKYQD